MTNSNFFSFSLNSLLIHGFGRDEIYYSIMQTKVLILPFIDEKKELHFQASSVYLLEDWLKQKKEDHFYEKMIYMIGCLSSQIQTLEKLGFYFLGFGLKDIVVVNDSFFFIVNNEYLVPFEKESRRINIMSPFVKPMFSSPEIIGLVKIPSWIFVDSCYYSLGALVLFCLCGEYLFKGNEIKNEKEIENILKPIAQTKMYWFLKRCFEKKGRRTLLYI